MFLFFLRLGREKIDRKRRKTLIKKLVKIYYLLKYSLMRSSLMFSGRLPTQRCLVSRTMAVSRPVLGGRSWPTKLFCGQKTRPLKAAIWPQFYSPAIPRIVCGFNLPAFEAMAAKMVGGVVTRLGHVMRNPQLLHSSLTKQNFTPQIILKIKTKWRRRFFFASPSCIFNFFAKIFC